MAIKIFANLFKRKGTEEERKIREEKEKMKVAEKEESLRRKTEENKIKQRAFEEKYLYPKQKPSTFFEEKIAKPIEAGVEKISQFGKDIQAKTPKFFGIQSPVNITDIPKMVAPMFLSTPEERAAKEKIKTAGTFEERKALAQKEQREFSESVGFAGTSAPKITTGLSLKTAQSLFKIKPAATEAEINTAFKSLMKKEMPRTIEELAVRSKTSAARMINEAKEMLLKNARGLVTKAPIVPELLVTGEKPITRPPVVTPEAPVIEKPTIPTAEVTKPLEIGKQELNVNKMNLTPDEKFHLLEVTKPSETTTMKLSAVEEAAKGKLGRQKRVTLKKTIETASEELATRQRTAQLETEFSQLQKSGASEEALAAKLKEVRQAGKIAISEGTDVARRLRARGIVASGTGPVKMTTIFRLLDLAKVPEEKYIKEAATVNWDNPEEALKFWNKYRPSKFVDWLDTFRYNNILSNPRIWMRNYFTNLEMTLADKPLNYVFSGDPKNAAKYLGGVLSSIPEAIKAFADSFTGKTPITQPDIMRVKVPAKYPKIGTIPTRIQEAVDKFFMKMVEEGERATGKTPDKALKSALYSLFRAELDPKNKSGQGHILSILDALTEKVNILRQPIKYHGKSIPNSIGWSIPFIRTPFQVAKVWIERSPLGVITLWGNKYKKQQVGKILMGSIASLIGWYLAMDERTTWTAPKDKEERTLWYDSGKKRMAIQVGKNWIPMMYFGGFALALALPAAIKYYMKDSPKALTDSDMVKIGKGIAAWFTYGTQQTWIEGLNNFLLAAQGTEDVNWANAFVFQSEQFIPAAGLLRYISTIVDPIFRQAEGVMESFKKDLPGLSKELMPYLGPTGEPSTRNISSFLAPWDVGINVAGAGELLKKRTEKLQISNLINESSNNKKITQAMDIVGKGGFKYLERFDSNIQAEAYHRTIMKESVRDRNKKYTELQKEMSDEIKQKVLRLAKAEKMGLSYKDRQLFTVADKYKAKAIHLRIEELESPKTKNEKFAELKSAGLITEDMERQVRLLIEEERASQFKGLFVK